LLAESFFVIDGSSKGSYYKYREEGLIKNKIQSVVFISKEQIKLSLKALTAVVAHELAHVYECKTEGVPWKKEETPARELQAMNLVSQWGFKEELEKLDQEINWKWAYYKHYVDKSSKRMRKAKRRQICQDCGRNIEAGEEYHRFTHKEICLSCSEYHEVLICMRWAYDQVSTKREIVNKVSKLINCSYQTALKAYEEMEKELRLKEAM